jgi:hypothetical protein
MQIRIQEAKKPQKRSEEILFFEVLDVLSECRRLLL